MILYQGSTASHFATNSDARFALAHGWSMDASSYVAPTLTQGEIQQAIDLCEQARIGCSLTDTERALIADYKLTVAAPGGFEMPSLPQNVWY